MKKLTAVLILIVVLSGCGSYYDDYASRRQHYDSLISQCLPKFGDPNFVEKTNDSNDISKKHSNVYVPSSPFFRDMLQEIEKDYNREMQIVWQDAERDSYRQEIKWRISEMERELNQLKNKQYNYFRQNSPSYEWWHSHPLYRDNPELYYRDRRYYDGH